MKVTEKCDVYSFGVLILEVIKGKHPGDSITSLTLCPSETTLPIKDLLDDRLSYPTPEIENVLISIIKTARACLNSNSKYRPTMKIVSNMLVMAAP